MTLDEELEHMRAALLPHKDGQVVGLYMQAGDRYFSPDFVALAIETFRHRAVFCLALEEKLNPLEQLGVVMLRSSAGLPSAEKGKP